MTFSKFASALVFGFGLTACTANQFSNQSDKTDSSIVGGIAVAQDALLAQSVALLFNRLTTEVCTVSILNNQFALTAAHCVDGAKTDNLYLIFDTKLRPTSITRRVVGAKAAAYYDAKADRETNTGDIALVRFAGGVPKGYNAVKFLPNPSLLKTAALVTVAGYGVTDNATRVGTGTLRATNLPILDPAFSETEMTLNQKNNSGACHGDSGGPVYMELNGQFYLWGVISRSINFSTCSEASIITNALMYLSWVKETILSMGRQKMIIPPDDGPLFNQKPDEP